MSPDQLLTRPLESRSGSAVDPLAEEITWVSWTLAAASPRRLHTDAGVQAAASVFDHVVEAVWLPGRVSLLSEVAVDGGAHPRLRVSFAVGIMGAAGSTAAEADAVSGLVSGRLNASHLPYHAVRVDPMTVLDVAAADMAHAAIVRQRELDVEVTDAGSDLTVLSRFNPTVDPWSGVARLLTSRTGPTRVRATVLPTEVTVSDRIALEGSVRAAHAAAEGNADRPDLRFQAERAVATLVDLRASLATPVLCAEVAVSSADPLPLVFLRSIGSQFTSEVDVIRRQGHSVVAAQRLMVGGFDLTAAPADLLAAHRQGLPVRGGLETRDLRDLLTLFECPVGWPVPVNEPVPTLPSGATRSLPVPPGLSEGLKIGVGPSGVPAHLPADAVERHALVTGSTGTGKTTFLTAAMLAHLDAGEPFLFVDLHGQAADRVVAHADEMGVDIVVIDAHDDASARVRLTPRLAADGANLAEVEAAGHRVSDAVAARYDKDWSGPRWLQLARASNLLFAAHGVEFADVVTWLADRDHTHTALRHPAMPGWARAALSTLHAPNNSDAAGVRDWLTCKFTVFTSATGRRIFAAAGDGEDLHALLSAGTPVIVNLSALSSADATMAGHLIVSTVLEAAMHTADAEGTPFSAYIDEAHRFPVDSLERIIAEGRKFGVSLVLATQSLTQFEPGLADLVSGAAVKLAFRQSPDSANHLAPLMDLNPLDLVDLPDLHAYFKLAGHPTCSVELDPYPPMPNPRIKTPPLALATTPTPPRDPSSFTTDEPDPTTDDHDDAGDEGDERPAFLDEWLRRRNRQRPAG